MLQSLRLPAFFLILAWNSQASAVPLVQGGPDGPNPLPPCELDSNDPRPVEAIDAYVQRMTREENFSGVVLIMSAGEVWFERAYELASIDFNVPNTTDTRFDVGSFNKDYRDWRSCSLPRMARWS